MDILDYLQFRFTHDERGVALLRYALIVAVAAIACVLAFTTVGETAVQRIWALGDKIAGA